MPNKDEFKIKRGITDITRLFEHLEDIRKQEARINWLRVNASRIKKKETPSD